MLTVTPLAAFKDNYIWLIKDSISNQAAVVDPGDSVPVINYLEKYGLNLSTILITHNHSDHIQGVPELVSRYEADVIGPCTTTISTLTRSVWEGDKINLFGHTIQIFSAQGHTLDHVLYFIDAPIALLFCGDTLFSAGCGRLFEGTPLAMFNTLSKIKKMPTTTLVFPAHEYSMVNLAFAKQLEPNNREIAATQKQYALKLVSGQPTLPSSIATELQVNPFLRTQSPEIILAVDTYLNSKTESDLDVFTALREWRNLF